MRAGPGSVRAEFGRTMAELCDNARKRTPLSVVAIDMPIGLPDDGIRKADVLARRFIRPRSSSVFDTPVREAIFYAAVDDVLDAAAMAWTARRILEQTAASLPDPPEVFSDGWPAAIWH